MPPSREIGYETNAFETPSAARPLQTAECRLRDADGKRKPQNPKSETRNPK